VRRGPLIALAAALAACVPDEGPLMRAGEDCLECHGGSGLPGEAATVADREGARRWTVAGTVYGSGTAGSGDGVRGAKVHVRDAGGRSFTLETNRAGNFYTAEPVRFPLKVTITHGGRFVEMADEVTYGGCNGCHRQPPRGSATGRVSTIGGGDPLMMPGEDCLECHGRRTLPGYSPTIADPQDGPEWTVAGTVFRTESSPANGGLDGAKVHVRDAAGRTLTLDTNRAGNFYTEEPMTFPLRVTVEAGGIAVEMEDDVTYGGCNGCHRLPPRGEAEGRVSPSGGED
jgi:hypothetical protein